MKQIKCDTCGNYLTKEELQNPRKNYLDLEICDDCYSSDYESVGDYTPTEQEEVLDKR